MPALAAVGAGADDYYTRTSMYVCKYVCIADDGVHAATHMWAALSRSSFCTSNQPCLRQRKTTLSWDVLLSSCCGLTWRLSVCLFVCLFICLPVLLDCLLVVAYTVCFVCSVAYPLLENFSKGPKIRTYTYVYTYVCKCNWREYNNNKNYTLAMVVTGGDEPLHILLFCFWAAPRRAASSNQPTNHSFGSTHHWARHFSVSP